MARTNTLIGYAVVSETGANRYYIGSTCLDCDTTFDPMFRNGVPCRNAHTHALNVKANWKRAGHVAVVEPIHTGSPYAVRDGMN